MTTIEVQKRLSAEFGQRDYREIGVAGQKDKTAVVTQVCVGGGGLVSGHVDYTTHITTPGNTQLTIAHC